MLRLRHYQPLVLIAANEADDKNEYNVDNGDAMNHATTNRFIIFPTG
jgi:hypothetical protein